MKDILNQSPKYSTDFCGDNLTCIIKLTQGQNFESMLMGLTVQNETFSSMTLTSSQISPFTVEQASATSLCAKIQPDQKKFLIKSGIGNGIEILLDLETFDNGNLDLHGDGLDVLITDAEDYSLPELKGFSVGPGTAVEAKINPILFTIQDEALNNFDYLGRKCVDKDRDFGSDFWHGLTGNYSISNCLVSATLSQIYAR